MAEFSRYDEIHHMLLNNGRSSAGEYFCRVYYLLNMNMGGYWDDYWAAFYDKASDDLHATYVAGRNKKAWYQHVTLLMEDGKITDDGRKLLDHIKVNKAKYDAGSKSINPFGASQPEFEK